MPLTTRGGGSSVKGGTPLMRPLRSMEMVSGLFVELEKPTKLKPTTSRLELVTLVVEPKRA